MDDEDRPEGEDPADEAEDAADEDAVDEPAEADESAEDTADEAEPDSDDGADDDAAVAEAAGMSRGRIAVLVGTLVVALAVIAFLAFRPRDEPPAAAPTTTTTTSTTTTTIAARPATKAVIATARNPTTLVRSTPPDGWATATPVTVWDNPAPAASQATTPPRAALPRLDYPIQGRYADAAGWTFSNPTAFNDPFVMLVTEQRGDWLKVQVPVRPNGTEGWVQASDVTLGETDFHIRLNLAERRLRLFRGNDQVMETQVVIGKDATYTPTGRFFVTDKVPQSNPAGAYGPIALPTSAYSEQIDEFDNGVPVIAMHGTNRPELVGQNVSNGCIRMPNDKITQLADLVPQGTPIDISA
jgi:lipoprotein-anchoring transpeptidase ErfK/SrfK